MRRLLTSLLLALVLLAPAATAAAQDGGQWITHVVQPEENLFRIALRYNLTVEVVMTANGLTDPNLVMVGQQIVIPVGAQGAASAPATPGAPIRTTVLGSTVMHTVAAGDTLAQIAAHYGVTISAVLGANQLSSASTIAPGQTLVIPVRASADLGLIGVALPDTPAGQTLAGVENGFTQPDLGLIGVAPITIPLADDSAASVPAPEAEAAPVSDPDTTTTTSSESPDESGIEAATDSAPDTTSNTAPEAAPDTAPDIPAASEPDTPASPVRRDEPAATDHVDDLGILTANANSSAFADATGGTNNTIRQPDLGIIGPETARLIDTGVISLGTRDLRKLYLRGLSLGNNPHAFAKVGDCNSEPPFFLAKFDKGEYNLGPYGNLQSVLDHFAGSFARDSMSVWTGNHVWALFDSTWANPAYCQAGETPLACEFRIQKPSIVLIRLGTNESRSPQLFEDNMRRVIEFALERGTIPVLGTKADRLEGSDAMNEIIRGLAAEYGIPLWDFSKAADLIPARGLMPDGFHLTYFPPNYGETLALQSGHGMQNLTALMTLDAVWRATMRQGTGERLE